MTKRTHVSELDPTGGTDGQVPVISGGKFVIATPVGLDAEGVRDTIAAALVAGTNITIAVDDAANTITISASSVGGGGSYPITRKANATATNPSTTSATFVAIDTTCDVTIPAAVGDVLEIAPNGRWGQRTMIGWMDAVTVVSGAVVNYCSGGNSTAPGVQSWFHDDANTRQIIGAPLLYTVQSGDISAGNVTIRLVYRSNTAGSIINFENGAASTASKLRNQVVNLGPN